MATEIQYHVCRSIEQIINLLYNEPFERVRAELATALGHGFAALSVSENPRRYLNKAETRDTQEGGHQYDTLQILQGSYCAPVQNRNSELGQRDLQSHANLRLANIEHAVAHTKHATMRHQGKKRVARSEPPRTKQYSPDFRKAQARRRQLTHQALDKLNWSELGILEERRTCSDGSVVCKSMCDQEGVLCLNENSNTILSTTFPDSTSEATVIHQTQSSEHCDSVSNSDTATTIKPEDSASNVGEQQIHCQPTAQQSTLGSLVNSVLTGWSTKHNMKELCLQGYRNVYHELRESTMARTMKPKSFRVDTETFCAHMDSELARLLGIHRTKCQKNTCHTFWTNGLLKGIHGPR